MTYSGTIGPGARNTDPSTSHKAASMPRPGNHWWEVLEIHYNNPAGLNDAEMERLITSAQQCPRKRRCDLMKDGYIEPTDIRRCGRTKALCTVWRITQKGKDRYEQQPICPDDSNLERSGESNEDKRISR